MPEECVKRKSSRAKDGKYDATERAFTDTEILDFLQNDIEENGAVLLHDGYGKCGTNRGLACVPSGLTGRTLREAIQQMMPRRCSTTYSNPSSS